MKAARVATALLMIGVQHGVFAADEPADAATTTSAASRQGIDLKLLLASVSQRTHKKFIIDPRIQANVQLDGLAAGDVTYPLLLTILAVHGFAVYEQEGVVVVTPDANLRFFPSTIVKPDDIRVPDGEVVTTIIVMKNVKATEVVAIVRPLVAPSAQINALADRNAICIVDRAANVRRLVAVIREMDKLPVVKTE